jgi:cellulose synthase/poly-beta-1,6-N-acetylglucosamine synthase-like glycosyltransferase
MIVYIVVVLVMGLGYYSLLSKYTELWNSIIPLTIDDSFVTSVTIVIPFRNEAQNLGALIKSLNDLELGHHQVEVLFINDHSTDNSVNVIADNAISLKYNVLNNSLTGKKEALKLAWQHASGDIVLQTDADCVLPSTWLVSMLHPFANEKVQLVSGPVDFYATTNFWSKMVRLDFNALIAIGAAHITWKKPMLCNGANLAYRKTVLESFKYKENKASGDDIYLLQHVHLSAPEGICFNQTQDAIVMTSGPQHFREFWNQRIRWASKNGDYDLKQNTVILAFVWFYNVVIVLSFLSLNSVGYTVVAFLVVLKVLAENKFYRSFSSFFSLSGWFKTILLGQPFHILYMAILPPLSQVIKYQWKERKVK